jgi:hypothetical protein
VSLFTNPTLLGIDHPSHLQDGDECVLIPVNITYGDDPPYTFPRVPDFRSACGLCRERTSGSQKNAAAHPHWF